MNSILSQSDRYDSEGTRLPLVEEFYTIQGEGFNTGKAAWFIRLGGCDIGCRWCDSRFTWNPDIHPLVDTDIIVKNAVGSGADSVVITGGEPLTWNLNYLCGKLKEKGLLTFIETSGAYPLSGTWDWICLSPKVNMPPVEDILVKADELKVIIESEVDLSRAENFRQLVRKDCQLFLQPEWSRYEKVIPVIVEYVKKNPAWKVSLQSHKFMHIP
ncbi:MAG: 7-carboxy-7-deazaguanine synthase QueE [Bacteroidales bacterium]